MKILESPSVLKPTYDLVRDKKANAGENVDNWTFKSWRKKNLTVELEEGTSILNISYRDSDTDTILDVLNKISDDYQLYSGRDRSKSIGQGLKYLENQVENSGKKQQPQAAILTHSQSVMGFQ